MVKSVGEDGFCLGKGECLGWRDLGRSARLRQKYEAIGNLRVATVEFPVRRSMRPRQKYEAMKNLRVATVGILIENVVSSSNI